MLMLSVFDFIVSSADWELNIHACVIAVFLELISDHKKSLDLQEKSSKVCASSAKPAAGNNRLSSAAKKECSSSVSFTHGTTTANQMSALSVTNSSAESAHKVHPKNSASVDRVAVNSSDSGMHKVLKAEDGDTVHSSTGTYQLRGTDVQNEEVSETLHETSRQKTTFRAPDVISALAADMVNLYRSKVLPTVVPSQCPHSAVPASAANSRVKNSRILCSATAVQMPDSSTMQLERTVASAKIPIPLVSKSPFKLVKIKTVQSSTGCGESLLPPVSKLSQAPAHFDRSAHDIPGKWAHSSTLTSSFRHLDSKPCSTAVSGTRTVSCSYAMPKSLSMQITFTVSSQSNAISNRSNSVTVSSLANVVRGKNAGPNVTYANSKYRLIRRRESACKNTSRRTSMTCLKDSNVTPFVSHQVTKHSPSFFVVNKYKLVRKKRHSLTQLAKRTTNMKRMSPSVKLNRDVVQPLCRNLSVSDVKTRSSRYKLVRKYHQPLSTPVKPVTQAASSRPDDKVQVLSKYKLVRKKSAAMIRTPQRATSTPTDSSQRVIQYTRSLGNKHITPPLFLNKYKLIRKRALLKSSTSSCTNLTLRSPQCLTRSRKPSAEGYKHRYSGKPHGLLETSPYKKRRTRKRSFLSKYALQRSGKGRRYFVFEWFTSLW